MLKWQPWLPTTQHIIITKRFLLLWTSTWELTSLIFPILHCCQLTPCMPWCAYMCCICVCICVHHALMLLYASMCLSVLHVCIHICAAAYMYAYTCFNMPICEHAHICACTHVNRHLWACTCTLVYIHTCKHALTHTYVTICMHTCACVYTHTCKHTCAHFWAS